MIGVGIGLGLSEFRLNPSEFSPPQISGLELWLDSSDSSTIYQSAGGSLAVSDGDPVGQWQDKSGKSRHATQTDGTKKPGLKVGIKNGKNIVRFDGSNDSLVISGSNSSLAFLHKTDSTIFVVFSGSKLATTGLIDSTAGSSAYTGHSIYWANDGSFTQFITNSSGSGATAPISNTSSASYFSGQYSVLSAVAKPANGTASNRGSFVLNSSSSVQNNTNTGTPSSGNATNSYTIGSLQAGYYLNGDIAEMIIYSSALSDQDLSIVNGYLNKKWSIY